ncbi:MAG: DUF4190 domain-containing protein [Ruminococcaceae bacterium]|nr:DUF4190 domain-containing protein [Oscillospiraceae bacterium]
MTVKNMSIVSLVCGILGFGMFVPFAEYVAPLCSIAGIVFGVMALSRINKGIEPECKSVAVGGIVLGVISASGGLFSLSCKMCGLCSLTGMDVFTDVLEKLG